MGDASPADPKERLAGLRAGVAAAAAAGDAAGLCSCIDGGAPPPQPPFPCPPTHTPCAHPRVPGCALPGPDEAAPPRLSSRAVLGGDLPQWIAREALQGLAEALPTLESAVHKAVASHCLAAMQPRLSSFEEQATLVREGLAGLHEREGDWAAAARALGGINLDSGPRAADEAYQLGLCVRAALLHLEAGDPVSAEAFVKRASFLAPGCADKGLALQYRACHARVLDSKRRFLDAAAQYYALSQAPPGESAQVGEEELLQALASAATCTILAAAGPKRSRMLATLLRDARCRELECWPLLEKVHTERMLEPVEVAAFARGLQEHQQAALPDGTTVLERAVAEHNLLGASKVYSEARFSDLGERLGVQADQVARLAASMIAEGRMPGLIDQVAGTIDFSGGRGVGGAWGPLGDWDARIKSLCSEANALLANVPLL